MQTANEASNPIPSSRRVQPRPRPETQPHTTRMGESSLLAFRLLLLAIYLNGFLLLVAIILNLTTATATATQQIPILSRVENPPTEVLALTLFLQGLAFLWCLPDSGLLMGSFLTKMRGGRKRGLKGLHVAVVRDMDGREKMEWREERPVAWRENEDGWVDGWWEGEGYSRANEEHGAMV